MTTRTPGPDVWAALDPDVRRIMDELAEAAAPLGEKDDCDEEDPCGVCLAVEEWRILRGDLWRCVVCGLPFTSDAMTSHLRSCGVAGADPGPVPIERGHLNMSLRYLLRVAKEHYDAGRFAMVSALSDAEASADEVLAALQSAADRGDLYVRFGDCDNFDPAKGCLGHGVGE